MYLRSVMPKTGPSFNFNGKNSKDFGITVSGPVDLGTPTKIKRKARPSFSNVEYDFSELYGSQVYQNRFITIPVNLFYNDEQDKYIQNAKIINWLMNSHGRQKLTYSELPNFYFLAEVVSDLQHDIKLVNNFDVLNITFEAYPFMISERKEGDDLWDPFSFDFGVVQPTNFKYQSHWDTFKELNVGDLATYGAWATTYIREDLTGNGSKITPAFHGYSYKIVDKRRGDWSRSKVAYKLENHDEWLLEQDIIQAQTEYLDINLINNGATEVSPKIVTNNKVSMVRGKEIYNLMPGSYHTEQFVLNTGDNRMRLFIANVSLEIDFEWYKELL